MSKSGPDEYHCVVTSVLRLQADGTLAPTKPLYVAIGDRFNVDRRSGRVLGRGELSNARADRIEVLAKGDSGQVYKAVWLFKPPNGDVYALYVREWEPGLTKPFVLASAAEIVSGTCQ